MATYAIILLPIIDIILSTTCFLQLNFQMLTFIKYVTIHGSVPNLNWMYSHNIFSFHLAWTNKNALCSKMQQIFSLYYRNRNTFTGTMQQMLLMLREKHFWRVITNALHLQTAFTHYHKDAPWLHFHNKLENN